MGKKDIAAIGSDNEKALKTLQAPEILSGKDAATVGKVPRLKKRMFISP